MYGLIEGSADNSKDNALMTDSGRSTAIDSCRNYSWHVIRYLVMHNELVARTLDVGSALVCITAIARRSNYVVGATLLALYVGQSHYEYRQVQSEERPIEARRSE